MRYIGREIKYALCRPTCNFHFFLDKLLISLCLPEHSVADSEATDYPKTVFFKFAWLGSGHLS